MFRCRSHVMCLFLMLAVAAPALAQAEGAADARSVEEVIRDVYDMVSWTDGDTPDWEEVRAVFVPEAVIVLRYPPGLQVMTVDGFLLDWLRFQNQLEEAGFTGFLETVRSVETIEFGDIAQARVVYESSIPERGRPPRAGVDLWSLVRVEEGWLVASVINELPRQGVPIPDAWLD